VLDRDGIFAARHDARPGSAWLLRPDGHVAARFLQPTSETVRAARLRARGLS
jgi:3-(3-hydroxy-phenyl)propionate hydroxylase